ncbi:hypothetical protein D515_00112 [Grimontia indica]|uniref:Uncharacterized protein n=1 Tax=Grimontia indica TaxID=1056512 RepID=R1H0U4_9GAMM|nr:hypothetical protein D515_00112 [Grimontia indica]
MHFLAVSGLTDVISLFFEVRAHHGASHCFIIYDQDVMRHIYPVHISS